VRGSIAKIRALSTLLVLTSLLFHSISHAEVALQDLRIWRRARVISGGQHVWGFQTSFQKITDRFGAQGEIEPLGQQYSRKLTWDQVVRAENTVTGKDILREYMRSQGLSDQSTAATLDYSLERNETGFAMDWAYGLTDGWMIGFHLWPSIYGPLRLHKAARNRKAKPKLRWKKK
jgi:hypothetical protein